MSKADIVCPRCETAITVLDWVGGPEFNKIEGSDALDLSSIHAVFNCSSCGLDTWVYYYWPGSTEGRFILNTLTVEELEDK